MQICLTRPKETIATELAVLFTHVRTYKELAKKRANELTSEYVKTTSR